MNDRIVDACAMQLVMNPWQFDVIVTTNLFGDILSDQLAGLVGGLGMAPGANIGPDAAIFEAVHGSAPDIAGKGLANPLALLLAACLMLGTRRPLRLRCADPQGDADVSLNDRWCPYAGSRRQGFDRRLCQGHHSSIGIIAVADMLTDANDRIGRRALKEKHLEQIAMAKGSDLLVAALENEGVDRIFGVPGEENLDVVESLRNSSIKLILTRHEQGAAFMAATYGRLTGRPGVCITTLGPGALNLTTGAAYALLGAMPMIMLTGQKGIMSSRQAKFQIVDVVSAFKPLTKLSMQIVSTSSIPTIGSRCLSDCHGRAAGPGSARIARGHCRRRSRRRRDGAAASDRNSGRSSCFAGPRR